jgi:hypothetical protein
LLLSLNDIEGFGVWNFGFGMRSGPTIIASISMIIRRYQQPNSIVSLISII